MLQQIFNLESSNKMLSLSAVIKVTCDCCMATQHITLYSVFIEVTEHYIRLIVSYLYTVGASSSSSLHVPHKIQNSNFPRAPRTGKNLFFLPFQWRVHKESDKNLRDKITYKVNRKTHIDPLLHFIALSNSVSVSREKSLDVVVCKSSRS